MSWLCIQNRPVVLMTGVALALFVGCSKEDQRGGPRVPTFSIKGTVKVDGQPAGYLNVTAIPVNYKPKDATPSGLTEPDGTFSLSTYVKGDGVPEGDYKLIFTWGTLNLMTAQYQGDKFNGKYADPEKSEVSIKVVKGSKPPDLGVIELTLPADSGSKKAPVLEIDQER